jgi:hypothetical protein
LGFELEEEEEATLLSLFGEEEVEEEVRSIGVELAALGCLGTVEGSVLLHFKREDAAEKPVFPVLSFFLPFSLSTSPNEFFSPSLDFLMNCKIYLQILDYHFYVKCEVQQTRHF